MHIHAVVSVCLSVRLSVQWLTAVCLQTLLPKMRQKAHHDQSFTEDIIVKLFCNMEDLHALHQRLLQDIAVIGENPSHHSTVARTYVKHVSGCGLLGDNCPPAIP